MTYLAEKHIEYDGYTFTLDEHSGYYLSTKNIGEKRIRLHVYIWTKHFGPPPVGYDVHHKDENKLNNTIGNYVLLQGKIHHRNHGKERMENPEIYSNQLKHLEAIRSKASEWHKSDKGREWHKIQYQKTAEKLHEVIARECIYCGKEFKTKLHSARYCSPTCRNKHHTSEKLDCIEKVCIVCGNKFWGNRWRDTPTCGRSCGAKLGHNRREA